jgi:hypothetical protein
LIKLYLLKLIVLIFFLSCENSTEANFRFLSKSDLKEKLEKLPNVRINEIDSIGHFKYVFELFVTQPVDHDNPNSEIFEQKIYLSHVDETKPMVFYTEGYSARKNRISEVSKLLQSNQIYIEYRYFGHSKPKSMDWKYLRFKQASEDLHHVITLLKPIYKDKWISTGVSKGGETAFTHRRYFPHDVDATIAYVAPLQFAQEDPRLYSFFETSVDQHCQEKIKSLQRYMLSKRIELSNELDNYYPQYNLSFNRIGKEVTIEYAVLEYMFSFWQYNHSCNDIPNESISNEDLFKYLASVVPLWIYEDFELEHGGAGMYQFMVESGYYGFILDHLSDLLVHVKSPSNRIFAPLNTDLTYLPESNIDINQWLQNSGDKIIYIYGKKDPWTACSVELNGNADAVKIIIDEQGHGANLSHLNDSDFQRVNNKVFEWTGYTLNRKYLNIYNNKRKKNLSFN